MPSPDASFPIALTLTCSRFSRLAVRLADVGVSSVTWRVVATLEQRGELRISDIAALEQVTRPTATTVVQRLEDEGVVARRSDPADARSSLVRLTDLGRDRLAAWRARVGDQVETLLGDLAPEDRGTLERAVGILGTVLDRADTTIAPATRAPRKGSPLA
ncbi:MarR family winged helix-turn-helix transcriptional regulator [Brachybacterium huguangmaarense]